MIWTIKLLKQSLPAALFLLALLLAILQPCPRLAGAERVYITDHGRHLFPFYKDGKTYLFGLTPGKMVGLDEWKPIDNAANWWVINDHPKTGFTRVVIRAQMASEYRALTPFYMNNHPYIFGLHMGANKKGEVGRTAAAASGASVGANIWRINDDPSTSFNLVMYKEKMSVSYNHVVSFQLKGEPYILGLHKDVGANIWRIRQGPKGLTFDLVKYKAKMSPNYEHLKVFYMGGHPYIFGLHTGESGSGVGANIWRIKDDPSQGFDLVMYGAKFPKDYDFVSLFHVGGRPYLFAAALYPESYPTDLFELGYEIAEGLIKGDWAIYEPGKGYGVIWEIWGDPRKPSIRKISQSIKISHRYKNLITFEQGGKTYIFGVHGEKYGNIWRVNDDPTKGFTLVYYGKTGQGFD